MNVRRKIHRSQGPSTAASELLPSQAELRRIAERVLALSKADETEVTIEAESDALTRFANNTIHQNVAEQGLVISVRAVVDGRTARATTNKSDEESLCRAAQAALELARHQPKHPGLLPMAGPQPRGASAPVRRYFEATATATPTDRARVVAALCAEARRRGHTAAGIFSTGAHSLALANSRGLFACHTQTRAQFSITAMDGDSSGWAKAASPDVREIDAETLARRAMEKAALSRQPREISPSRMTVILEPAAVLDLVGFLFYDFAGTAVFDRRSCFNERMGKQVFGKNIQIWDDVYHPLQTGAPFDGEGLPRQRVRLVEAGVPKRLVYSRATAKKMKAKPTGHGLPLPNEYGEAPTNLVLEGSNASLDSMIASTERGVVLTRVWYVREVDPYEKVLTGMTRDGTFLVEDGRVVAGLRNMRFNVSVLEMLSKVEQMGPAVRASGEEAFDMVVPAMRVRDFHFTELTKF
jgi:predicted Zn-dependent protease